MRLLIIGGGPVAAEKLRAVLSNSPATHITLVAPHICPETKELVEAHGIHLQERAYLPADIAQAQLVIAAVGSQETAAGIMQECSRAGKLVNVADKPALCNFYLGSVVQKGSLKIAISTNGTSPTMAKRLRETLEVALPQDLELLLQNMARIRSSLRGHFREKVEKLNRLTQDFSRMDP